jgi:hypothetical protein
VQIDVAHATSWARRRGAVVSLSLARPAAYFYTSTSAQRAGMRDQGSSSKTPVVVRLSHPRHPRIAPPAAYRTRWELVTGIACLCLAWDVAPVPIVSIQDVSSVSVSPARCSSLLVFWFCDPFELTPSVIPRVLHRPSIPLSRTYTVLKILQGVFIIPSHLAGPVHHYDRSKDDIPKSLQPPTIPT